MEIQNNLENKKKFFCLYFGQKVVCASLKDDRTSNLHQSIFTYPDEFLNFCLQLTPLSSITDEDSVEVVKLQEHLLIRDDLNPFFDLTTIEFSVCFYPNRNDYYEVVNSASVDYLRSKGYALPYMGLSVEKQIEYGWIKLAE